MTISGPTWVFHRTLSARIVRSQPEYEALGNGWADTPAAFVQPEETPEPPPAPRPRRRRQEQTHG